MWYGGGTTDEAMGQALLNRGGKIGNRDSRQCGGEDIEKRGKRCLVGKNSANQGPFNVGNVPIGEAAEVLFQLWCD